MATRILIVEDNEDIAVFLQEILGEAGHETVRTPSGRDGVLLAAQQRWDLALVDVEIEDLSGFGVTRILQDLGSIPTVLMSARSGPWCREGLEAGATACLPKPFSLTALLALIEAIVTAARLLPWPPGDVRQLSDEDLARVMRLSTAELDKLPFGLIRVDAQGVITAYNAFEGHVAGRGQDAVGQRFADLAPCAMTKEFVSVLAQGFAERRLDVMLRFFFPVHEATCVATIRLFYDELLDQMWIFVTRRRSEATGTSNP